MSSSTAHKGMQRARAKMAEAGLPDVVVKNFERLFGQVLSGESGVLTESEIEPVDSIDVLTEVASNPEVEEQGRSVLDKLVVVRLNGGLGTTMGLEKAKSLLPVKGDLTFNDIIARQLMAIGEVMSVRIPLVHMTSFSTDADVNEAMTPYTELHVDGVPRTFQQHKHPKIYVDTMMPASEAVDELNWNPPGHGDIYAALIASGLAQRLLEAGKRYMFVANADNLGATVDPAILGYLVLSGAPFLMETAQRTPADAKGGHLARRRTDHRLVLRETSQAPVGPDGKIIPEFGDIGRYRHFNTNNIWLDLEAVLSVARGHDGCIPLPLISNKKTVNPRDCSSPRVIQIETAMGAAIEVFEGARAILVPRSRFAPVKSNNDLLVVRSDVYELGRDFTLSVSTARSRPGLPLVSLDQRYFGLLADFESRMRVVPSLLDAESFSVEGDVVIDHALNVHGRVNLVGAEGRRTSVPEEMVEVRDGDYRF